jgi:hypothetical protein
MKFCSFPSSPTHLSSQKRICHDKSIHTKLQSQIMPKLSRYLQGQIMTKGLSYWLWHETIACAHLSRIFFSWEKIQKSFHSIMSYTFVCKTSFEPCEAKNYLLHVGVARGQSIQRCLKWWERGVLRSPWLRWTKRFGFILSHCQVVSLAHR